MQKLSNKKPAEKTVEKNPALSLLFSFGLCVLFAWAGYNSLEWPTAVRQFPLVICIPGFFLALMVSMRDLINLLHSKKKLGTWKEYIKKRGELDLIPNLETGEFLKSVQDEVKQEYKDFDDEGNDRKVLDMRRVGEDLDDDEFGIE